MYFSVRYVLIFQTHFVLGESRLHKCYRDEIVSDIDILMGGRVAEELIYGKDKVSTGATGDMIRATGKARRMVKSYGFSDTVSNCQYMRVFLFTSNQ